MIMEQVFHLLEFIRLSTTSRNRLVKLEQIDPLDQVKGGNTAQTKQTKFNFNSIIDIKNKILPQLSFDGLSRGSTKSIS